MCAKCEELKAAASAKGRESGDALRLQYGDEPILTYSKDGRLTIHTVNTETVKVGMSILSAALEQLEEQVVAMNTKQQLLSMAVGALHGWLKSIDPDADADKLVEENGDQPHVLSVNMPPSKTKS